MTQHIPYTDTSLKPAKLTRTQSVQEARTSTLRALLRDTQFIRTQLEQQNSIIAVLIGEVDRNITMIEAAITTEEAWADD